MTNTMSSTTDSKNNDTTTTQQSVSGSVGGDNVPSGFILKLFQMVNGAPDEVIRWAPDGDAFIIGSDIERLESETLPQYFRHNRFQSLVRQLNFYSFRKINRERNVWIYKHDLFHRDRPEDLYMVRRRTCPGLDGRKQRFSSRKGSKKSDDNNSDDESTTLLDEQASTSAEDRLASSNEGFTAIKKRNSISSTASPDHQLETDYQPKPKKARSSPTTEPETIPPAAPEEPDSPIVDTSIIRSVVEVNNKVIVPRESEEGDDSSLLLVDNERNEKLEMLEQSMVVSDVAMKLEEYARRAWKENHGTTTSRTRRGGAGVVTPPFGSSSYQTSMSASGLLTYDDEYESGGDEDLRATDLFGRNTNSSVVTESDVEETHDERMKECVLPKELLVAPVSMAHAKFITERLLVSDVTSAAVAGFCMSTAPNGNPDMSRKILQLIASCETLASDFHQYRSALKPMAHSGDQPSSGTPFHSVRMNHVQNWEREGSRSDAVRDFKVFSVNCVHKVLGKNGWGGGIAGLSEVDRAALERTANAWLKSVGTTDCPRRYMH